jgi:predicted peptidase
MGCKLQNGYSLVIGVNDITVIRNHLYIVAFNNTCNNILLAQNYVIQQINANGGQITNSVITNNLIFGQITTGNTSGSLIVSNNVLGTTNWTYPIDVNNATIQNNIVVDDFKYIDENSGNTITYNLLATDGTNSDGNQYNIDMNLVFADYDGALDMSTDGKWKLKEGSPAIGAGISGADCGAFYGPSSYVLSGIPGLPHIYEADVPVSATSESGLEVTIKVMSGD